MFYTLLFALGFVNEIYFSPSNDCENLIIRQLDSAKSSINIVIYSITSNDIIEKIKDIKNNKKEVEIRLIVDKQQNSKNEKIKELELLNIPVIIDNKSGLEHNKVLIVDKTEVITGSYNWSNNAKVKNSENCLYITDTNEIYYNRFNYLLNDYYNTKYDYKTLSQ